MTGLREPAKRPCGSCPYRRDVPSGIWHPEEYAKLPAYDRETPEQPTALFGCHQQDGRVCAGWAGCHDMGQALAVRVAAIRGDVEPAVVDALLGYSTPTPLFGYGAEAAAHGVADVAHPSADAVRVITKLTDRRSTR